MVKQHNPKQQLKRSRKLKRKRLKRKLEQAARKAAAVAFYQSDEWRKVRYEALKQQGASCQCCGRTPREHQIVLHVDHIKPKSQYPSLALDINNLQVLCEDCNLGKMARDTTDWRKPAVIRKRQGKLYRVA